jgi:hypothetical protein
VQDIHARHRSHSGGDLLDDPAHILQLRPRMVAHPLAPRLAVNALGHRGERATRPRRRQNPNAVRACDEASDPHVSREGLDAGFVALSKSSEGVVCAAVEFCGAQIGNSLTTAAYLSRQNLCHPSERVSEVRIKLVSI